MTTVYWEWETPRERKMLWGDFLGEVEEEAVESRLLHLN